MSDLEAIYRFLTSSVMTQSAAWFTQYLDAVLAPIAQRVDQ
jgi:hypothetical protein